MNAIIFVICFIGFLFVVFGCVSFVFDMIKTYFAYKKGNKKK